MFHLETFHPEGESPFSDLAEFEAEANNAECLRETSDLEARAPKLIKLPTTVANVWVSVLSRLLLEEKLILRRK
jgi:hypothetical protein